MQKRTVPPATVGKDLQWDDVRYFLEMVRQGTLSGAARRLGVEHTTVARRVEALEAALGIRLFDRLPRGWQLTPEGETLADQGRRIEDETHAFARTALGVSSLQGIVRISAPPVVASHFLVPRLVPVCKAWPGIDLEIVGESREANLARGEADLALRLSRPTSPGLAARPLADIGYGLYASGGYAKRSPEKWNFLGYDDSLREVPQQQWLERFAAERRFVLRSNDLAALYQGVKSGLGVTILPHFLGKYDDKLLRITGVECPVKRRLWLAIHPDVRRSPRVRAVANALGEIVVDSRALLAGE